jgi:hypothetical protein
LESMWLAICPSACLVTQKRSPMSHTRCNKFAWKY